jgi:hypothetical protein
MGRLPDDVAALIAAQALVLPKATRQQLREAELAATTDRYATHPATAERIASVERWNPPGVFALEGPASRLFAHLDEVSREATLHHYRLAVGEAFREENVFAATELTERMERDAAESVVLEKWLGTDVIYWLDLPEQPEDVAPATAAAEPLGYDREEFSRLVAAKLTSQTQELLAGESIRIDGVEPLEKSGQALRARAEELRRMAAPIVAKLAEAARGENEARQAWAVYVAMQKTREAFCESFLLIRVAKAVGAAGDGDAASVAGRVERIYARGQGRADEVMEHLKRFPSPIVLDSRLAAFAGLQLDPGDGDPDDVLDRFGERWAALARLTLARLCRHALPPSGQDAMLS